MRKLVVCLIASAVGGCASKAPSAQPQSTFAQGSGSASAIGRHAGQADRPQIQRVVATADPAPIFRPVVNLAIFRYSVPRGTVSAGEAFWKRIDESAVDAVTYDVLFKNGLRVGRAPLADLNHLMALMEQQGTPRPHPMTYAASGRHLVPLRMKEVPQQIIYHFDRRNELAMRSYDASENLIQIEFEPVPRRSGDVRVSLVPMVRTMRKRIVWVNDEELDFRSDERFFDLNLRADIPLDNVLIVAPSPEARARMSLGHSFLMQEGATGMFEDVLLLVPQPMSAPTPDVLNLPAPDQGGLPQDGR